VLRQLVLVHDAVQVRRRVLTLSSHDRDAARAAPPLRTGTRARLSAEGQPECRVECSVVDAQEGLVRLAVSDDAQSAREALGALALLCEGNAARWRVDALSSDEPYNRMLRAMRRFSAGAAEDDSLSRA